MFYPYDGFKLNKHLQTKKEHVRSICGVWHALSAPTGVWPYGTMVMEGAKVPPPSCIYLQIPPTQPAWENSSWTDSFQDYLYPFILTQRRFMVRLYLYSHYNKLGAFKDDHAGWSMYATGCLPVSYLDSITAWLHPINCSTVTTETITHISRMAWLLFQNSLYKTRQPKVKENHLPSWQNNRTLPSIWTLGCAGVYLTEEDT